MRESETKIYDPDAKAKDREKVQLEKVGNELFNYVSMGVDHRMAKCCRDGKVDNESFIRCSKAMLPYVLQFQENIERDIEKFFNNWFGNV